MTARSETARSETAGTRERLLTVSAGLFRNHGYAGTGLKRVVSEADAQLGSLYHFFPGGKQELAVAVVRWAGQQQTAYLDSFFPAGTGPVAGIDAFFADAARLLRESGYAEACPITMLALEAPGTSERLREVTAEAFENWISRLAGHLADGGIAPADARTLALAVLTGVEGAFVLGIAARSDEALEVSRAAAVAAIRAALPPPRPGDPAR